MHPLRAVIGLIVVVLLIIAGFHAIFAKKVDSDTKQACATLVQLHKDANESPPPSQSVIQPLLQTAEQDGQASPVSAISAAANTLVRDAANEADAAVMVSDLNGYSNACAAVGQ